MSQLKVLKQFGQYRSGTCVTAIIVREAFDIAVLNRPMGFKHSQYNKEAWDTGIKHFGLTNVYVGVLISVKDPYSWIVSIDNFKGAGFVRSSARYGPGNRAGLPDEQVGNRLVQACGSYNMTLKSWLDIDAPKAVVNYEDLLSDLRGAMEKVGQAFDIEIVNEPKLPHTVIGPGERVMHSSKFDPEYYTEKKYLDQLTPAMKKIVDETIDWDIMATVGYTKT